MSRAAAVTPRARIYASDWVATKLRWKLTVDTKEQAALEKMAGDCPDTVVEYEVGP
ncbi:hypothetical protein [Streptomyces sp. NPDC048438]|uniref:hypothetical protein n=1 Tax=Streptomyces sp. NPDC048438 TaxID=3365551 RepID=UPI003718B317